MAQQQPPAHQPNDPIAITLTAMEWNNVLGVLSDGPYKIVAPLIQKIHEQGNAQGAEVVTHPNGAGRLNSGEPAHVPD